MNWSGPGPPPGPVATCETTHTHTVLSVFRICCKTRAKPHAPGPRVQGARGPGPVPGPSPPSHISPHTSFPSVASMGRNMTQEEAISIYLRTIKDGAQTEEQLAISWWHQWCTLARDKPYFRTAHLCFRYVWYAARNLWSGLGVRLVTSQHLLRQQRSQRSAPLSPARRGEFLCQSCEKEVDMGYFCQWCGWFVCTLCLSYKRGFSYPLFCRRCEPGKAIKCQNCNRMVYQACLCQRCDFWTCLKCLSFEYRYQVPICQKCDEESDAPTASDTASTATLPDYRGLAGFMNH